ncbi:MAG: isoprenyl transferase [Dehalococcoidia bacterium]|nr:isoprenyl transferase [Dehalococcoidia bacterium]
MAVDLPQHVAIIMDGNGRWAKKRGLPRIEGHRAGTENILRVAEIFAEYKIKYLTLFAFSTENWNRPSSEVKGILRILSDRLDQEIKHLHEKNIRVRHLGRLDALSPELQKGIKAAIELTSKNTGGTLTMAFDYGGRAEIVEAARRLVSDRTSVEDVNEDSFKKRLYAPDIPDPDLIIRTSGETRLSNFLLWQAAYSELYFTDVLWPDFNRAEIDKALADYKSRQRRFGRI